MNFYGIDLHTDNFTSGVMPMKGECVKIELKKWSLEEKEFNKFKELLEPDDYVLIESCSNAFWFHDQIKNLVKECIVYNTNVSRREGNKTDKIDARKLTKKLAYAVIMGEKSGLPQVYVPAPEAQELRGLFSTYNLYKKQKTQVKNRIHSILKQNGYSIEKKEIDNGSILEKINQFSISAIWKFQITSLMELLKKLKEEQEEIKDMIFFHGNKLFKKEINILMTIYGVSPLIAIAFMADVVDINRFPNVKMLCSYLRTAPKINASNRKAQIGSVNRASRATTCALLAQSANHFKLAGEHMKSFYERISQGKSAGKSRMALIRKIVVSMYHMLKRNKKYRWIDDIKYARKIKDFNRELERINFGQFDKIA